MKVKFANARVNLWDVKPGVVVTTDDGIIGHISKIGRTNHEESAALGIIRVEVVGIEVTSHHYSDDLKWCGPF